MDEVLSHVRQSTDRRLLKLLAELLLGGKR